MKETPGENSSGASEGGLSHILLVDDEAFIRDALQLYFESNGFKVSTASGGSEALKIFARQMSSIDLVLLDLVMPGMHGLEVLRELKKTDPGVQVIIATGCNSMDNAFEALRLGAIDYITKPILDFEKDLLKTIDSALGSRTEPEAPRAAEVTEAAGCGSPATNETSRTGLLETLAGLAGSRLQAAREQALAWNTLKRGFGSDAALVIRKMEGGAWQCLQSWGFIDMDAPRDLWHTGEKEPPGAGSASSWSGVLHVPFGGEPDEDYLLLLFYRNMAISGGAEVPIETLSAIFSHVYRCARTGQDNADSVATHALDSNFSS